ncbi:MAG: hypothetical protein ACOXZM_01075 [Eubacteriales bacterium]
MRAQDGDKKFLPLPEVFLIDGGMEHAKLAREVLDAVRGTGTGGGDGQG